MVRTTTTRIIAIGYGGGEGWNWICLSCGHPYCSCCGTSHRDPQIKRNIALGKDGYQHGRRGCEICGSTKVALKDEDVGDFLEDLRVKWITKQKKPWNACIGPIDAECPDRSFVKEGKWRDWAICRNWAVLNDGICPEDDHDGDVEELIA